MILCGALPGLAQQYLFSIPSAGGMTLNQASGVAVDLNGDIIIAQQPIHQVAKFDAAVSEIWRVGGSSQFNNPRGAAVDQAGNIYIADYNGRRIRKLSPQGTIVQTISMSGRPTDVAIDSSGSIYAVDDLNNKAYVFSAGGALLFAFGESGSQDGQFNQPSGVAVDSLGNIYVADAKNNRVQKFNAAGTFLFKLSLGCSYGSIYATPRDIAIDSQDNAWVLVDCPGSCRVEKYSPEGTMLFQFGSSGTGQGQFSGPAALGIDSLDRLFVLDIGRLQVFTGQGQFVRQYVSSGSEPGLFDGVVGLDVDNAGNLYVADANNKRIQVFDHNSAFLRIVPTEDKALDVAVDGEGNLFVCGPRNVWKYDSQGNLVFSVGGVGQFSNPRRIALDATGNIWVADTGNNRVLKLDPQGNVLLGFGYGAGDAHLNLPCGIEVGPEGNIYVADSGESNGDGHSWVKVFSPEGAFLWKFGGQGYADGQMLIPVDLSFDAFGNIYVSEQGFPIFTHGVQKFDSMGRFLLKFGTRGAGPGQFGSYSPSGIAVDKVSGRIYVADTANYRVSVFGLPTVQAFNQNVSTPEDTSLAITLTASDSQGDPLTFSLATLPLHGTLSGTLPNLTYQPALNYNGSDQFKFKATDGHEISQATVTITVNPVNDPPVAQSSSVSGEEDSPLSLSLQAFDVDNSSLNFLVLSSPQHGTLSGSGNLVIYLPFSDYNGPDAFSFIANDGSLDSNTATVSITVTPVNDPPVCSLAVADPGVLWPADHKLTPVQVQGVTDVDGDPLTIYALAIVQNEAVQESGDGGTSPDGTLEPLQVRAEAADSKNGRIYSISFVAKDPSEAFCTGVVTVCVRKPDGTPCQAWFDSIAP